MADGEGLFGLTSLRGLVTGESMGSLAMERLG